MANMNFKANILPATSQSYNLGSSTQQWNVHGSIYSNGIYGTPDIDYGDILPTSATEGQIFFQTDNTIIYNIPSGGTAGNALIKNSNEDGDIIWGKVQSLPDGGTIGQVLTKNSNTDGDASWATIDALPIGGLTGQALIKTSNNNGDASWANITYANTADYATSAGSANYATSAAQDNNGNIITTTYLTIADATSNYAFKSPSEEAAIDNNDAILFADSSNNGIITKSTIKFNGSTTSSYLSQAGTWESAPVSSVAGMTGDVVLNSLIIGEKSYNGTSATTISIADLGLSSPMTFKGVTDTALTNEDTTTSINIISGGTIGILSPLSEGDVVLQKDSQLEYIYSGSMWHQLGLASSYSLANHSHGNIENKGLITTTATIANGDRLIIADASDSDTGKLVASSIAFDGTTTDQVLSKAGTWTTVSVTTAPYATTAGYATTATHYVLKTGDTMTGNLTISKASSPTLNITNTTMNTQTATLAEAQYASIYFRDKNSANNLSAYIQSSQNTSGDSVLSISSRRRKTDDSGNINNAITLTSKTDGTLAVSVSTPAGWRSAINAVNKAGDTMTGLLKISVNSNTVTIGSQNAGFCHFSNSADIPFWFNKDIQIENGKVIGGAGTQYRPFQLYLGRKTTSSTNAINSSNPLIEFSNADRSQYGQLVYSDYDSVRAPDSLTWVGNQANSCFSAPRIFGAVWNDYAEYRETKEDIQPGRCVVETGKGDLILSTERFQEGCEIVSDTFGFAIGETKTCKTPTACAGRVLAYLYEDNSLAKPGRPVCSGPNGTVSLMSNEEAKEYPWCIIGTISEIPDYDEWEYGSADEHGIKKKLKVDGRVWIRIR